MIRIDKTAKTPVEAGNTPIIDPDIAAYCFWEGWSADLATGMIQIGDIARQRFGIETPSCGFLLLINASEPDDRQHILTLFEEAATVSSSFCYATTIENTKGERHAVFCIGESSVETGAAAGHIRGLFSFPRFQLSDGDAKRRYLPA